MKKIVYYTQLNGNIPLEKFYAQIFKTYSALLTKIYHKIDLLWSNQLGNEEVKYLWDKIYELRIRSKHYFPRVIYFISQENSYVMLDGYSKKDHKINMRFLDKVKKYKNDYLKQIWKL